ncbi:unnamed protein product, partial [marine sediment metagenome]
MLLEKSFERVHYMLRPSKQVERKLFIETMHRLNSAGYDIFSYSYLGLGSIFYVDFRLFHRYLYIDDMICAEATDIPDRMNFNRPYGFIDLRMKPVSEVIPTLSQTRPYLVWLDYDTPLSEGILEDVDGCLARLSLKSILLITVKANPPTVGEQGYDSKVNRVEDYQSKFGSLVAGEIRKADFAKNTFPRLLSRILRGQIGKCMRARHEDEFFQLFNFSYSDGTPMVTVGGLIDEKGAAEKLRDVYKLHFTRQGEDQCIISVPPLTVREKHWIDQQLKRPDGGPLGKEPKFELDEVLLANYVKYYRHY